MSGTKLKTSRAYAASVHLPDGRIWVLGGSGSTSVLQSTEMITVDEMKQLKVVSGPNLPEPLMDLSAAWISATQVVVVGGFSTIINDHSPIARVYDFSSQLWTVKPWYQRSCVRLIL
jgi:hypothetical protein